MTLGRRFGALILVLLAKVVSSQDCSSLPLNWTNCLAQNLRTCSSCNTTTEDFGNTVPTCASTTNNLCPIIRCCSACEDIADLILQQCIVDQVLAPIIGACDLNCSGFAYGDGNVTADACIEEAGNLTSCYFTNAQNCSQCNAVTNTSDLPTDTCEAVGSSYCAQLSCCPSCASELSTFYTCATTTFSNISGCQFDSCSSVPTAPSTPAPSASTPASSPAPTAVASPTSPTPTSPAAPPSSSPVATSPSQAPTDRCESEINTAELCVAQNILSCAFCAPKVTNATNNLSSIRSCSDARSQFCPVLDCCPQCADEAQALFQCEVNNITVLTNCALTCASTNNTNSTSAATTLRSTGDFFSLAMSLLAALSMFGFA